MKVEKFKVLLYLKKSEPDKNGKAPIMGRITLNRTMAQFSCKLSCTPELWNARESRLNGKSREAVETNEKIERLLLAVHSAFNSLMERKKDFDAAAVRDMSHSRPTSSPTARFPNSSRRSSRSRTWHLGNSTSSSSATIRISSSWKKDMPWTRFAATWPS